MPDAPPRRTPGGRGTGLLAALAVMGLLVVMMVVIRSTRPGEIPLPSSPFDPATTDPDELRRVAEAVSRVIAARPEEEESAIQTLESVRAESAGARDLKDACVNTYRGMRRAQASGREAESLLLMADGGERRAASLSPAERVRAEELLRSTRELTELVAQSQERCHQLYAAAVQRFHLPPARRAARRDGGR
jgi:hypothetical protein